MRLLKKFSKKLADIQAFIILSVIYFTVASIFSLIMKHKENKEKFSWEKWTIPSNTIEEVRRQY